MSNMNRLILCALAATCAVWLAPLGAHGQSGAGDVAMSAQWGEVTGSTVRIRAGASTQFQRLAVANRGDRFVIIGERDGWVEVQATHEFDCFVHASLVEADGSAGRISAENVVLRLEPSTQAFRLGTASQGAPVTILERRGEWLKIVPPAGVGVWMSGEYIREVGPVSRSEFEAYRLGNAAPAPARAPQDPVSSESSARAPDPDRVRQAENAMLQNLDRRFADAMAAAGSPTADEATAEQLRRLAREYEAFAAAVQSESVAGAARERAQALTDERATVLQTLGTRRDDTVERNAEAGQPAAPATADSEARRRAQERLLYRPSDDYIAQGQVVDARDRQSGRQVYILVHEGEPLFQIRLAPETRNVDLRALWHRTVAVRGRIVKIDGEDLPTIVCTEIVTR